MKIKNNYIYVTFNYLHYSREDFLSIINGDRINNIICDSFDTLLLLNDICKKVNRVISYKISNMNVYLVDDYKCIDRSYINMKSIDKLHFVSLPISYLLWNPSIKNNTFVNLFRVKVDDGYLCYSANGNKFIKRNDLDIIRDIVDEVYYVIDKNKLYDDIYKILIVSDFIQKSYDYYMDDNEIDDNYSKLGWVENLLHNNRGLCIAFSTITTLLCNNNLLKLNVRSVYGDSHAWNVVFSDDDKFFVDNTWNITRNKKLIDNSGFTTHSFSALDFCSDYIMFGRSMANDIGHHNCGILVNNDNLDISNYINNLKDLGIIGNYKKIKR